MGANEGVTQILNLTTEQLDRAAELDKLRRNITVLFTDLKGSTAYFEKYGDSAGLLMVHQCNTTLGQIVEKHGGRVIKTIGDAVMAAFEDCHEGIAAAIEMQEAITSVTYGKQGPEKISIRIGLNYGLGIVKSNDVFGDVVNVASRVEGAASPEQILISNSLYEAVAPSRRFNVRPSGKYSLKGKAKELDLYEVVWRKDGGQAEMLSHSMILPALEMAAHTRIRLQQVRTDGQPGREFDVINNPSIIGQAQGDFTFPNDAKMQPQHCRLSVQVGQLFVAPVEGAPVFFSLIGAYRLEPGDVVRIGNQIFEFRVNTEAMQMGSRLGAGLGELSNMLQHPVAEFVSLTGDQKHYSVLDGQVTFGRTKANYTFPTDTAMSRLHAKVYHRGEDFFLEDTGSTNGTFVLAREEVPVPAGSILAIGGQRLKIHRLSP